MYGRGNPTLVGSLLLTPTSSPWSQGGCGGKNEKQIKRLLPTPRANIAKQGLRRADHWGELRAEVMSLLPTPVEGDSRNSRNGTASRRANSPGHPGRTLSDVAFEWIGESSSQPSDGGRPSSGLRLSPWFVEWMMGVPAGWSDPGCRLSAMEFSSSSGFSLEGSFSMSSESE
jgi:hypothetical protein